MIDLYNRQPSISYRFERLTRNSAYHDNERSCSHIVVQSRANEDAIQLTGHT